MSKLDEQRHIVLMGRAGHPLVYRHHRVVEVCERPGRIPVMARYGEAGNDTAAASFGSLADVIHVSLGGHTTGGLKPRPMCGIHDAVFECVLPDAARAEQIGEVIWHWTTTNYAPSHSGPARRLRRRTDCYRRRPLPRNPAAGRRGPVSRAHSRGTADAAGSR